MPEVALAAGERTESQEPAAASRELHVVHLGLVPYEQGLELQRAVARARISGAIASDVLLLLEHPPVITLGRGSKAQQSRRHAGDARGTRSGAVRGGARR